MSSVSVLINGEAGQSVSVFDRGLQFGDGLFETIACVEGRLPFWEAHMHRLASGCQRLGMPAPDSKLLLSEAQRVSAGQARAIVKIIITRGTSARGYAYNADITPDRVVIGNPWMPLPASYWQQGVAITRCQTALAQQPLLAGIKHLNRLEQVLARAELTGKVVQEGLVCDTAGYVIEATAHNLFLYINNEFVTPSLVSAGVAGIMRERVLDRLVSAGHKIRTADIRLDEVHAAQSVFLCNSIHGIWPVRRFDETLYTVHPTLRELTDEIAKLLPYQ